MQQSQYDPGFVPFGGGSTHSILHPAVLVSLIVAVLLTFLLPRKYVILPLLFGMLLIPSGQNLYLGGVHVYVHRILILIGWARLFASKPSSGRFLAGGFSTLDKVFLVWAIYRALSVVLIFLQSGAVVNQVAFLLDALGGYFLFRSLVRDDKDVLRVVKVFAVVAAVSAAGMILEKMTHQNIFGLLGGIRQVPEIRNGRLRAQGVFQNPIIAGCFGATTFPLFLALWKTGRTRVLAVAGAVSSVVMAVASASSTPVGALLGGIFAVCLWPIRKGMRVVLWGIVLALLGLELVMKAPVWYLLARVDLVGGSSGWDRAFLIDTCIKHIGDWWLIGTHANVSWGWNMWDQCNQFVLEAETGGLVALTCFIAMLAICFKKIGTARKTVAGDHKKEWLVWLLGAALFAQVMVYIGIDYFDQSKFVWYALLAIIPAGTMTARTSTARDSQPGLVPDPIPVMSTSECTGAITNDGHPARPTISSRLFR
jgi:hypothetical protein